MSKNDQILVKKHKGKYYVFNVMAESWSERNNLYTKDALGVFKTREEALAFAHDYNNKGETEYGVWEEYLAKDGAKVRIIK